MLAGLSTDAFLIRSKRCQIASPLRVLKPSPLSGIYNCNIDFFHFHNSIECSFGLISTHALASIKVRSVICQETPHRSLHQPHMLFAGPRPDG